MDQLKTAFLERDSGPSKLNAFFSLFKETDNVINRGKDTKMNEKRSLDESTKINNNNYHDINRPNQRNPLQKLPSRTRISLWILISDLGL